MTLWDSTTDRWDDTSVLWGLTFPDAALATRVEVFLNNAWQDITSYVYGGGRDTISITRGRSDEGSYVAPSKCTMSLNNRDGRWSPRNPVGPYYGQLKRNTPIRVRLVPGSDGYLYMPARSDRATTPDSAGLSITGDIDIRVDYSAESWTAAAMLLGKYEVTSNQRSWALWVNGDRTISFRWSPDGTLGSAIDVTSTAAFSEPASGRAAVRVTLDVDNGSGGRTATFYTADEISGTWTQLGSAITTAGTTSIYNSTAQVEAGKVEDLSTSGVRGRIYNVEIYSGIGGTLRAGSSFGQDPDASSFTDTVGNTWTLRDNCTFVDPSVRFRGEVTEWPQRWDTTGTDVYVPITCSGILRRMTQGASPLNSVMRRAITFLSNQPVAYWPAEDGREATELASGVGCPSMAVSGSPSLASFDGFKCSSSIPTFNDSQWSGIVPTYTHSGNAQVRFLMYVPSAGAADGQTICRILTRGSPSRWELDYGTGGALALRVFTADGTNILDTGNVSFDINNALLRVSLEIDQVGADINWNIVTLEVGQSVGLTYSGTITGRTVGRITDVVMNPGGGLTDTAVGHISVHSEITSIFDLSDELNAYRLERAGQRIRRLCQEEGIPFRAVGDPDDTVLMGYQLPNKLVDLLREAADVDLGILYEPRDRMGIAYRIKTSLYNQEPALTLDYSAAELSEIEPEEDDQSTVNDITVSRLNGSSARLVKETGIMSVEDIGRYDSSVTINLNSDTRLADHAGWRLRLGTVDEARYPILGINLARDVYASDQAKTFAVQDLDVGGRLVVTDPPSWLPPDDITQLAQGFTEVLGNFTHTVSVNCSPESPWRVAKYGEARYSSDGTTLFAGVNSTATSLSVSTPSGPKWSHADGDFAIRMGGEVMTVTNVTGTGSTQTFTVVRSVNGVVKSHAFGAEITLDHPPVYAI
jgi:hypothetical protein